MFEKVDRVHNMSKRSLVDVRSVWTEIVESIDEATIRSMNKFLVESDNSETIRILTILSKSWTIWTICREFSTTYRYNGPQTVAAELMGQLPGTGYTATFNIIVHQYVNYEITLKITYFVEDASKNRVTFFSEFLTREFRFEICETRIGSRHLCLQKQLFHLAENLFQKAFCRAEVFLKIFNAKVSIRNLWNKNWFTTCLQKQLFHLVENLFQKSFCRAEVSLKIFNARLSIRNL